MSHKTRIELDDSLFIAIEKLAENNPGAIAAIAKMISGGPRIDPDCVWGPLGPLLALDMNGIYGPRIWVFYKDICECNVTIALALLRAVQLGFMAESELNDAIGTDTFRNGRMEQARIDEMIKKVKEYLPAFDAVPA